MYRKITKPFLDFLVSLVTLVFISPVFLIIALILLIQNSGTPFFFQERIGKDNKIFKVIKFKTMNDKTDVDGNLLKDMDRITYFGNMIRKTSLDELPQLLNVLNFSMSIVGPRPLLKQYLPFYSDYHIRRHEAKPGITGLAQVNGRNFLKFSERFNLDVEYVINQSFILDIKIILLTVKKIFKSNEISMGRKMSEVDDIGITRGLASHYFNKPEDED